MGKSLRLTYKEKLKRLSHAVVEAQRPIRILDSIKWPESYIEAFRKSKFKEIPQLGPEDYAKQSLGYDPEAKRKELRELREAITREMGEEDALGGLLRKTAEQYERVVEMLEARGTRRFWELSRELYGSPKDTMIQDHNTISDLGRMMYEILSKIEAKDLGPEYPETYGAQEVVDTLNQRLQSYFPDIPVMAKLSDGILADAAAGGETVKIKESAKFSQRDVDILEVHEGWVHIGTTQNGRNQHLATWLSKGPPRCSSTQEGLAVIMEIFTFRTYPKRAKQINDRILGIEKVEDGADLLELMEFYRTEGYTEEECLKNVKRVFRGGMVEGGAAFTKDISYCRGFIENYNFMRSAVRAGRPKLLPFLFVGKLHLEDVPLLYAKHLEGLIDAPKYLPPQFRDLHGLSVWMGFSSFLNMVNLRRVQEHYDKLFRAYL